MKTVGTLGKLQPLWIAAVALVALPLASHAIGLTTDTASTIVILAIAAMGLNLCVGYAGLVSFGHSAWFGVGAYAAALLQKYWFNGEIALPIVLSMVFVALASTMVGFLHSAAARRLLLAADARAFGAQLHRRLPLDGSDRR